MYRTTTAFLDRDGVINRDEGYTHIFRPDLIYSDMKSLSDLRLKEIFIVTNQSGIGRGYYTEKQFHNFMAELIHHLHAELNLKIKDYFYCPHSPTPDKNEPFCACRKPKPGMFFQAKKLYKIDFSKSFMIGDKISDVQAGFSAGIRRNFLIRRPTEGLQINTTCIQTSLTAYASSEIKSICELKGKLKNDNFYASKK